MEEGGAQLPVVTVRATFDEEDAARRSAPLLRSAGVVPCYVDEQGELREL